MEKEVARQMDSRANGFEKYRAGPNAAPEWQAGSLGWRSRELVVACPLEGLVRSVASDRKRPHTSGSQATLMKPLPPL